MVKSIASEIKHLAIEASAPSVTDNVSGALKRKQNKKR